MSGYLDSGNVPNRNIPGGYAGTADTIKVMHRLVTLAVSGVGPRGESDDRIVRLARRIVADVPAKDYVAEAAAILKWCQDRLRYVRDPYLPNGLERLQHPSVTIFETASEDCDGLAVAFSALAAAVGCPWAFRTVGQDPLAPRRFAHVLSLVQVGGAWVQADPSFQNVPLGWEPPDAAISDRLGVPAAGIGVWTRQDWLP